MDDGVPLLFLSSFKWRLRRRAFFKRFEARAPVIGDAGDVNANDNVMRALAGMRTRSTSLCLDRNARSVKLCGFLDKIFAFKKEKKEKKERRKEIEEKRKRFVTTASIRNAFYNVSLTLSLLLRHICVCVCVCVRFSSTPGRRRFL